jgi:hypothetical protein
VTERQIFFFTLWLEGADICTDESLEALHGIDILDDITVGSVDEESFAMFSREAFSYEEAVKGATRDIESTIKGARVVRVERHEEDDEPVTERAPGRVRRHPFRAVLSRWS